VHTHTKELSHQVEAKTEHNADHKKEHKADAKKEQQSKQKKEKKEKKSAPATEKSTDEKKKSSASTDNKKSDAKKSVKKSSTQKTTTSSSKKSESKAAQKQHESKAPHLRKVVKPGGEQPSELEVSVAKALLELEVSTKDMTADMADLFFLSAKEIDVHGGKKAVVIFVPFRQHKQYKKIQGRLIRELEKKLSKYVVIIAQRTILPKNYARAHKGAIRPRSRTLTTVHNAVLDDLVYPTAIVGKRLRVRTDGARTLRVLLDPREVKDTEYKLRTFQTLYKRLTNKTAEFAYATE